MFSAMETPASPGPSLACPTPFSRHTEVTIGHGGGGKLTQDLIDRVFRPAFSNRELDAQHDGAILEVFGGRLAFSTDAHVVSPLFFPGGNIGTVAVYGTANDLSMCGSRPEWMSASFIMEEGFPLILLEKVAAAMGKAAAEAGVRIVTGDTKVVERGKGDGLYITTAGVGVISHNLAISPASIRPGDAVLLSGDIGRHGMAILASREGLSFESPIQSDCASLVAPVQALLKAGLEIHCMRDLTRGGLATALIELAESSRLCLAVDETLIPVTDLVRGACEILGLEPCYVANEGRFVCILPEDQSAAALDILAAHAKGGAPARIGSVRPAPAGTATLKSVIGADRILDRLSGEQLPRIC